MKIAFAYWENRIAPVFDTAQQILIIDTLDGYQDQDKKNLQLDEHPLRKALFLAELGINILVCGAISKQMYSLVAAYGIDIIPFVAGELSDVIKACLSGDLKHERFSMPGCCARGKQRSGRRQGMYVEGFNMNNKGQRGAGMGAGRGSGQGAGRGQGRNTTGRGRMGGPLSAGPAGNCLCPVCGHQQPHERGAPCVTLQCPKCGAAMVRA